MFWNAGQRDWGRAVLKDRRTAFDFLAKLAEHVRRLVNPKATIEFQSYRQAYDDDFEDIRRRVPDLSRLRSTISYQPGYTLEMIIRDVHQYLIAKAG